VSRSQLTGSTGLSRDEWLVLIATFQYVFETWPDNFYALLDAIPHARNCVEVPRLNRQFGTFYSKWLYNSLADDSFSFIREAFGDYLKKHYTGGSLNQRLLPFQETEEELLQDRRYLTMEQTKKMLGTSFKISIDGRVSGVPRLIKEGVLRAVKVLLGTAEKKAIYLIEKTDVEALLRSWNDLLPLRTIQQSFLGISKKSVIALTDEGLLTPTRGPTIDRCRALLYSRAEVERFIADVLKCSQRKTCSSACVPLARFRPFATWTLNDTIVAVLNGSLKPIDTETQQPLFQRLVLPRGEENRFLEERLQRRQVNLKLFTVQEVAARFRVSIQNIQRWIDKGLIAVERLPTSRMRSRLVITQESLEAFRLTYLFSEEVVVLLGITRLTLNDYVRRGKLHSLGDHKKKYLFLREEVEALKLALGPKLTSSSEAYQSK
jgi:hypothetical protein